MTKLLDYQKSLNNFMEFIDELVIEVRITNDDESEVKSLNILRLRALCLLKRLEYLEINKEDFSNKDIVKGMIKYFTPAEIFILNDSRSFPSKFLVRLEEFMNKRVDRELRKSKQSTIVTAPTVEEQVVEVLQPTSVQEEVIEVEEIELSQELVVSEAGYVQLSLF